MIFLWLSICCSVGIYLLFKLRKQLRVNLPIAIIINYLTAASMGIALNANQVHFETIISRDWLPIASIIGFLFVVIFYFIGVSSEKTGISYTTMATRLSMVFPILVSIIYFEQHSSVAKFIKITLAIVAVSLAIYHKPTKTVPKKFVFLPLILFVGSGTIDSLVKTAQQLYIPENETQLFSIALFAISFFSSFFLLINKQENENTSIQNTILLGLLLGSFNYGSLVFFINALNNSGIDSSILFGINNITIVCLSLFMGYFLFKEKLSKLNWIGIAASICCLILLL